MLHAQNLIRSLALPVIALLLVTACAGGTSAGWTYAPLGPSANPSAAATAGASGAPSGSGAPSSPSGSGGTGTTINLETQQSSPVSFNPADFTVPAGATVTVDYANNSSLMHNVNFFDGPDNHSNSLGATTVVTGPNNTQSVTFTAPTTPGDYFFWCDVHTSAMVGHFHVQ